MFLHVSVIHSVHRGGVGIPACNGPTPPMENPPDGEPPRMENHHPPGWENPPGWRTTTPPDGRTPPDGHCAGGTHPTGMHSCFFFRFVFWETPSFFVLVFFCWEIRLFRLLGLFEISCLLCSTSVVLSPHLEPARPYWLNVLPCSLLTCEEIRKHRKYCA